MGWTVSSFGCVKMDSRCFDKRSVFFPSLLTQLPSLCLRGEDTEWNSGLRYSLKDSDQTWEMTDLTCHVNITV